MVRGSQRAAWDAFSKEKADWDAWQPTENEAAPKRKRKKKKKPPAPEDTESPEKPAVEHEEAAEADAKLGGLGHAAAAGAADSSGKCGGKALQCVNDKRAAALGKTAAAASAPPPPPGRNPQRQRQSPSPSPAGAAASAASEEPRRRRVRRRRRRVRSPSPAGAVAGGCEENSTTGPRRHHQPDRGGGGGDDQRFRVSVGTAVLVGAPYAHLPPPAPPGAVPGGCEENSATGARRPHQPDRGGGGGDDQRFPVRFRVSVGTTVLVSAPYAHLPPPPPTRPEPKRQPNFIPLRAWGYPESDRRRRRRRAASGASQPAVAAASAEQALEPEQPAGADRPAAGGAPQPAVAASAAEQAPAGDAPQPAAAAEQALEPEQPAGADRPAAGGAPQPATPPAEADAESFSPDWSRISFEDGEVAELHERLREVEEADDISPDVQRELGRILFKKKTVTEAGFKRQYVASRAETISSIKKLLQRRKDFMAARGLHDGASHIVGGRYLFTQQDRHHVMKEWKKEFHAAPEQVEQQKRDSWKPQGRPRGGDWGPNTAAVRHGKHLRLARHLQLEAGSKARTSGSPLETHVARWPCGHVDMWPCGQWKGVEVRGPDMITWPHGHRATWPHGHVAM